MNEEERSILPDGIEVDALFLANAADVPKGLVYVLGGGWTRCWPSAGQTYPHSRQIPIVLMIRVPYQESNREHKFAVLIRDGEEMPVTDVPAQGSFKVGRDVNLTPGMSQLVTVAMAASARLEKPGIYQVVVEIDEVETKRIQFEALERQPR